MKLYMITSRWNNEITVIDVEVKECEKTYTVTKSNRGCYFYRVNKEWINWFDRREERVFCFDLEKGKEIFSKGIEEEIKIENERYQKQMERLNDIKSKIN